MNGGAIGALFDCHGNWTAAIALMDHSSLSKPPLTLTTEVQVWSRCVLPGLHGLSGACLSQRPSLDTECTYHCLQVVDVAQALVSFHTMIIFRVQMHVAAVCSTCNMSSAWMETLWNIHILVDAVLGTNLSVSGLTPCTANRISTMPSIMACRVLTTTSTQVCCTIAAYLCARNAMHVRCMCECAARPVLGTPAASICTNITPLFRYGAQGHRNCV